MYMANVDLVFPKLETSVTRSFITLTWILMQATCWLEHLVARASSWPFLPFQLHLNCTAFSIWSTLSLALQRHTFLFLPLNFSSRLLLPVHFAIFFFPSCSSSNFSCHAVSPFALYKAASHCGEHYLAWQLLFFSFHWHFLHISHSLPRVDVVFFVNILPFTTFRLEQNAHSINCAVTLCTFNLHSGTVQYFITQIGSCIRTRNLIHCLTSDTFLLLLE